MASIDPKYIFLTDRPQLIDEWQVVPGIWDAVRHECDGNREKGNFILTGSTSLDSTSSDEAYHSGTGRIATIRMHTMSLYESGDSTGKASIGDMLEDQLNEGHTSKVELDELAHLIVRGGWPENIDMPDRDIGIIPRSYIDTIVAKDMHEGQTRKRDPNRMRMLLRSLSRNETTLAGDAKLVRDIEEYENEEQLIESRAMIKDHFVVQVCSLQLTNCSMTAKLSVSCLKH